jgi:hypothetical protein
MFVDVVQAFAAATTVGLLIYSMDSKIQFDPLGLDEDITPAAVRACVERHDFSKAITMAVFLNEQETLKFAVEAVPKDMISLVAKAAVTGESCLKRSGRQALLYCILNPLFYSLFVQMPKERRSTLS